VTGIDSIRLRCLDPAAQRAFYCSVLGMRTRSDGTVGYPGKGAGLDFVQGRTAYTPDPADLYWKISIAVPDLDLACAQLQEKGIAAGPPEQFGDIGYLAHFKDPEGFAIELIAHQFKGRAARRAAGRSELGGGPALNLLTLRAAAYEQIVRSCDTWGMSLLAIMPVEQYGFTLHFYAFTEEVPPSPDPYAIENRTWVYQRPYTVLEIQHRPSLSAIRRPGDDDSGYVSAKVAGASHGGGDSIFGLEVRPGIGAA